MATKYRLILINDASPEVEITEYLRSLTDTNHVIIIENAENLGFTATVNHGMTMSDENDVLLLNSDTEVANDWLDKLIAQAYSDQRVGTVTPFSNNATICNYPTLSGMQELPPGESVQSLDRAFASANLRRNIEIPTAVGFCMYIRRDCLNEVGLFDVETFGKGYGEENDFCLRATNHGWKHLLAADTFVFHEGEVSFQEGSNPRKKRAMGILRKRYPDYEASVTRHIISNEAYPLRIAATAARFRKGHIPVVLQILHAYGGGTEKNVIDLRKKHIDDSRQLIINPAVTESGDAALQIRSGDPLDSLNLCLPTDDEELLTDIIKSFGVSLVHIHHVIGYSFNLHKLIQKLGVPFYLTIHDYLLACPYIYMNPTGQKYCGEPEPYKCNQCISMQYPNGANDIIWWRESHSWMLNDASVVICPTHDVAKRCKRYFANANYLVVAHESSETDKVNDIKVPQLQQHEPIRIALLGALARHKGLELFAETLRIAENNNSMFQFQLIGYAETGLPHVPAKLFQQSGHYQDSELQVKIDAFDPHLILFISACPETYSYTLSAALKSKRPVMAVNLGAFAERISARSWSWIIEWEISPIQLVEKLNKIRSENFIPLIAPSLPTQCGSICPDQEDNSFYEQKYLLLGNKKAYTEVKDIRAPGKITAIVLIEKDVEQPTPCAYIRLILPLIQERGEKFDLRWVTPEEVCYYVADVLIIQRTAVTSISSIDKISAHCEKHDIRIVYDLDDLLIALPDEHPESKIYAPISSSVFRWLLVADEVWVSTEKLLQNISKINARTFVIPNYLDHSIWGIPKALDLDERVEHPVRILYMGTHTHIADFELTKDALKKIKYQFENKVEITLIGIIPDNNKISEDWFMNIHPPKGLKGGYPAFVNWITNDLSFDIGIAPLLDNEFNCCKSEIKFLDYSALGMATVASDVDCYAMIRNGENGFKVINTEKAWHEAIELLITDAEILEKIKRIAYQEFIEKFGYERVKGLRTNLLNSLLSEDYHNSRQVEIRNDNSGFVGRNSIAAAYLNGVGIEVGALHNPLPVTSNAKVRYVDRMDKPGLYEQYPELRQHNLVDVDFVDNGETLLTFKEDSQDFIIANHFLEHCEDPIATLIAFNRVLKKGGVVFLALPDKRFTFDKDRQRTTLAHLIRDHEEGTATSRYDHFREWPKYIEPHFGRVYKTEAEIDRRASELMNLNYSIHYHVWEPVDVIDMLKYCTDTQRLPIAVEYFLSKDDEMVIILRKHW
jgi:GT2 family glycosyltransferase/SAM-dependent methyltransferase